MFASSIFLYLFLPALLAVYYAGPRPARNAVLLAAGNPTRTGAAPDWRPVGSLT